MKHAAYRLRKRGLSVETQKPVPVYFEEVRMECGYRADLVVEEKVVVDTKTIDLIADIEIAQLLTHLQFLNLRYGLILNFKVVLMKYGIKRVLRGYQGLSNVSIEVKFVYASNSFRNRKPRFKSLLFLKKISAVISAVETAIVSLILPS